MIFPIPPIGSKRRHYKSTGGDNHTYEIVGLGKHSETEELLVVYRPLFDAEGTRLGRCQYVCRPLAMWYDIVEYKGKNISRFTQIKEKV